MCESRGGRPGLPSLISLRFLFKGCGRRTLSVIVALSFTINDRLKWHSLLPILMQESFWWWHLVEVMLFMSTKTVGLLGTGTQDVHLHFHTAFDFWWWQCRDRYIISLPLPPPPYPLPTFSPSLISLVVSVDVKHRVYLPGLSSR